MKIGRIASITKVFVEEGLGYLTRPTPAAGDASDEKEERPPDAEAAARLRRTLERLGPTFVKFGQLLGTRVDLFSEEFVNELGKLHSHVEPFAHADARAILEKDLGKPVEAIFEDFPDAPIAAASIAQVYKARLRDAERSLVAVKVQRPGLEKSLLEDLDVLMDISGFIDAIIPQYHRSMVHRVAEEYAQRAKGEIDFIAEANAIGRFADVLETLPEFRAPKVYRDLCTPRVLVMEWLEGTKLDSVPSERELAALGFEPHGFARSMLRLQLSMAYEHGFVHGDTHPGNIILLPTGQIGIIDFGLHGHVPRALRDKMLEMIFDQASGKIDEAVDAFITVFQPDPSADLDKFRAELRVVLTEGQKSNTMKDNRVTEQLVKGMRIGARYHLKAQSDLFMVIRNLTIVEGIILKYCPSLDLIAELRSITGGIMRRRLFGPSMRDQLTELVPQVLLTLSQRPRLAEKLLRLERSFSESKNLGDFLRREQVIREVVAPRRDWLFVVVLLLGAGAGVAFEMWRH
jgi:ubiquinone biosynthesis protein